MYSSERSPPPPGSDILAYRSHTHVNMQLKVELVNLVSRQTTNLRREMDDDAVPKLLHV
jgi:hypothetical protein